MKLLSWFFDFPVSTGVLIIATVVIAAAANVEYR